MTKIRFFNPGASYLKIKPEIDEAIQRVLAAGDLILRQDVEEFEKNLASYVGTKYAVGVNSGTDALSLSLAAYGTGPKDTVLCPSYTFRATPDTALRTGAKVVLYDLDERPRFDGITVWMPAHIAGYVPEWMEEYIDRAHKKGIVVIEDACQAIGAAPVTGETACYSFYPAKILGCYGDGGAIATNDESVYLWLKRARNHFKGERGEVGMNSRLDNLQAAVLNVKMRYLQSNIERRRAIARAYETNLRGVTFDPSRSVYQDFIIGHENTKELATYLANLGIETMANGYPFAQQLTKGPKTVEYEVNSLRIPCNPDLTNEEVQYVIDSINSYGK